MSAHLTARDLDRLRTARLPAGEVLAVTEHLAGCGACRQMAEQRDDDAARFLTAVAPSGDDAADHLDPDSQLYPYVDRKLSRAAAEDVEAHLAGCEICREDVADLRAVPIQRRVSRRPWIAVAAATAAVIALVVIAMRMRAPTSAPPAPLRASAPPAVPDAAHALLRSVIASGRLDEPAVLLALRPAGEPLRGPNARAAALLEPVGAVVESVRPRFSWTPTAGATFRVSVLSGDRVVAQSPFLANASWDCDRGLARGGVYSWQVEVNKDGVRSVMPDPAEGDALFRVLDDRAASQIDDARKRFPDDHLLAGVLYAHYGVRGRAEEELQLAAANPARAADARRLLDDIRQWGTARR